MKLAKKPKISKETLEKLYHSEKSVFDIAKSLGVSRPTIHCWVKRYNIQLRRKSYKDKINLKLLEKLYLEKNKPMTKIAKILGIPQYILYFYKAKYALPRNPLAALKNQIKLPKSRFEIGFIVGLIVSEGTISVLSLKRRLTPRLNIANTNLSLLKFAQKIIGGCVSKGTKHKKQCYNLSIRAMPHLFELLNLLNPFMPMKHEHAELVAEFCELRMKNYKNPYTPRELEIVERVQKLNKR